METYYQLHREEILKKQRERRLKKLAELPPEDELREEIKKLQQKVNRLEEQVEYYKNLAAKYRQQRMEANEKLKEAKSSQLHLSDSKKEKIKEQIAKLEHMLQREDSSRKLNSLRREKIKELKKKIGMPLWKSVAFGNDTFF